MSGWRKFYFWQDTSGHTLSDDGDWYYENCATFARPYGAWSPMEDFATYFALVMMEESEFSYSDAMPGSDSGKDAFMADFLANMS